MPKVLLWSRASNYVANQRSRPESVHAADVVVNNPAKPFGTFTTSHFLSNNNHDTLRPFEAKKEAGYGIGFKLQIPTQCSLP